MNVNLIYQLVELAISLAQNELDGSTMESTLIDIIQKGVQTYQEQTGKALDPRTVGIMYPL
jgi:hypothetical protein